MGKVLLGIILAAIIVALIIAAIGIALIILKAILYFLMVAIPIVLAVWVIRKLRQPKQ